MNRRKAIAGIFVGGFGVVAMYSGYKWHAWNKTPDWRYLREKKELIATLVDLIIPGDTAPGERQAGVQNFIVIYIEDCADIRSANIFIDGLRNLENYALTVHNRPFQDCAQQQQSYVLQHFAQEGKRSQGIIGKVENRMLGESFFSLLKHYTVLGYGSSELGATRCLSYISVPGSYQGCIPLHHGQRAWATK